MNPFSKEWFIKHQTLILLFANTKIGRYVLRIHGDRSKVGDNKILKIYPNAIVWQKRYIFKDNTLKPLYGFEARTNDKFALRLYYSFYYLWVFFHFLDMNFLNIFLPKLNLGFDLFGSAHPDPTPGVSTHNAQVLQSYTPGNGVVWGTIRAAAGNDSNQVDPQVCVQFQGDTGSNHWARIIRSQFLFDTSIIGTGHTVVAATLTLIGTAKADALSATPSINVFSSNPASNTSAGLGDYGTIGSTPFATAIPYASWSTSGANIFTLNSSGVAAISITGITKLGVRNPEYDLANVSPTWIASTVSSLTCNFAEHTGTTSDPALDGEFYSKVSNFTDSVTFSDTIGKLISRTLSDTLAGFTSTINSGRLIFKTLSDSVTFSDNMLRFLNGASSAWKKVRKSLSQGWTKREKP